MKTLTTSTAIIIALGLTACASKDKITPREEAEAGRANLERVMAASCHVGDSAGIGAQMTLEALPVMDTAQKPEFVDYYSAIIDAPSRPSDDLKKDPDRKPADVLAFAEVRPGMQIFEMEAGSGYFTEILSIAVGDEGRVYMQNPAAFDQFWNGPEPPRISEGRLENVTYVKSQFDNLKMDDSSVDMVTWMQGPHKLWDTPDGAPDGLGDAKAAFAEIERILKPGGAFVVLDHAALPCAPQSTGGDKHRIDPAIVIELAERAGFTLIGSSNLFVNPEDPKDISIFDPSIRGKTDQFLFKFVKSNPAG